MKTLSLAALMLLAACGGNNLSFGVRAGTSASTVSRSDLTLADNITLTHVRIVIRDLQLEGKDGKDDDDSDDKNVASGPYLLDLPAAALDGGSVAQVLDAPFEPGTYKEIKMKIHKLTSSDSFAGNAGLEAMNTAGASIIAEGTIDGAAFTYQTSVETKQEFKGTIELKDGSNLTLNVDPTGWFTGSGGRLDPRVSGNASAIDDNIKKSFKAFKDDDKDGKGD